MARLTIPASLVAVVAVAVAGWLAQKPSTSLVSVLSRRLLHEEPMPGSLLVPAFIAAAGDACVGRENACDLAFALEAVIPRASLWPDWPEVYHYAEAGDAFSDEISEEFNALGDGEAGDESSALGNRETGGWEELDGIVALNGVAARLLALAPGPDARASALMEIPIASKAIVTRFFGALGAVPLMKEKKTTTRGVRGRYIPTERTPFARGHFGEVWRARAVGGKSRNQIENKKFVLKRVLVERGEEIRNAGRREAYFGQRVAGGAHVARYESAFELIPGDTRVGAETELWLVFRDEGESLASLMYTDGDEDAIREEARSDDEGEGKEKEKANIGGGGLRVVKPSRWWLKARATTEGKETLREMLRQVLQGLAFTHDSGVGHRDVKPANLLVAWSSSGDDGDDTKPGSGAFRLRLADFGSAVDEHALANLYGTEGPSAAQQTLEYAPPESIGMDTVIATKKERHSKPKPRTAVRRYASYDAWSVGVLALEVLCLGTPKVFASVDGRTAAAVTRRLQGASEETKEMALRLRAMLELCVVPPSSEIAGVLSWQCTEDALFARLKARDPTGRGLHSRWALRLVRRLLSWDPGDRPSAERALRHAYFREGGDGGGGRGWRCPRTASEFEFADECRTRCAETCE
jgi:serine/threonine protein kinase